ncbi:unnamed protein product, partial [Pylaiella littoralis]
MGKDSATPGMLLRIDHTKSKVVYNALRRLEWQTNREVDKAVRNLMASSNKGGVDSTQFKAKKTAFRESQKLEGGQAVKAVIAGWKCSTYQYLGSMQMKTTRKGGNVVQYVPKERYFDNRAEKSLLAKAKEAIAREEAATKNSGASMFQKPFWKNNPDLNEGKVQRQINKQVKATVWMAQDYPLKLKHIMPALEIISVRDDMAARLRSVLSLAGIPQEGFPVKVSVPLMMTVKAVVTFENFRSDGVDKRDFVIPSEYKRSRRMSKEGYIAGVGSGAGGAFGETSQAGTVVDSEEEEEEEEEEDEDGVEGFVDEVDEGELSERELLRRRAASRTGFDDDEDSDSDSEDMDVSDDGTPSHSPQVSNAELSAPRSPVTRTPSSPPELLFAQGLTSTSRERERDRGREDASRRSSRHSRGRSTGSGGSGGIVGGSGGGGGGEGSSTSTARRGRASEGSNVSASRRRSKSRSGRFVSQLKGIVKGKGPSSSSRRGSATREGDSRSDDGDDYEGYDFDDEDD